VNSYHEGYPWSDSITQGVLQALHLGRSPLASTQFEGDASNLVLRVFYMDTKRNGSEEFGRAAAARAKAEIDSWKPDVVICSDDNAAKYLIVPHFKGSTLPFVFCGVNWDAAVYGLPWPNVTGMVEVSLIPDLLKLMQAYSKGVRVGLLGARNESNLKEIEAYRATFHVELTEVALVDNLHDWEQRFLALQKSVDMLILAPPSFLAAEQNNARHAEAEQFARENTRIPTGSVEDWIAPYSLLCLAKKASEQGEWAAHAALRILDGTPLSEIPITMNQQATIYLNMPLAKRLGIHFPVELIDKAVLLDGQGP
jgi:ABC-type uncharacterized transport system substrate-binding protein